MRDSKGPAERRVITLARDMVKGGVGPNVYIRGCDPYVTIGRPRFQEARHEGFTSYPEGANQKILIHSYFGVEKRLVDLHELINDRRATREEALLLQGSLPPLVRKYLSKVMDYINDFKKFPSSESELQALDLEALFDRNDLINSLSFNCQNLFEVEDALSRVNSYVERTDPSYVSDEELIHLMLLTKSPK